MFFTVCLWILRLLAKLVQNRSKLDQEGFQEVRTGRGSVLTEYEPAGPHGGPIHEGFCSGRGYSESLNRSGAPESKSARLKIKSDFWKWLPPKGQLGWIKTFKIKPDFWKWLPPKGQLGWIKTFILYTIIQYYTILYHIIPYYSLLFPYYPGGGDPRFVEGFGVVCMFSNIV